MDRDRAKRWRNLKVIISESVMVLAVIITVVVLAFVVSGYWLNSDFKVERQGMLQISSVPTGADVTIDDKTAWLQRTNTSKVLSSGEHTISLTKEGYDSWSKTIDIKEGLLYRIHYPRLFWQDRTASKMHDATGTIFATMNADHDAALFVNNTTKWQYLDLTANELKSKSINVATVFSTVSLTESASSGLFTGKIKTANWDSDGNHILFQVVSDQTTEWVLLDVKNPDQSINLTKEFGGNFSKMQILDNNSNNILAIQNGNLHRINVATRQLSSIMVENINCFDHYENEIVFSASRGTGDQAKNYIGYLKVGNDDKITNIATTSQAAKVLIGKFYDQKYIAVLDGFSISVYSQNDLTQIDSYDLSFTPSAAEVGHDGEYIIMSAGAHIATLDLEASVVREWEIEGETFGWIDNDMIYTVRDGELVVYDFDGYNRRGIAKNVSDHFPVGITDNKWLYYFSDDYLMREWIVEH